MNIALSETPGRGDTRRRAGMSRAAWGLLAAVLVVCLAWLAQTSFTVEGHRYFVLADDAMISMRYAYFLAHGQGLVWNPGQRVEGFTNFGWTLIMGAVHLLPVPLRFASLALQLVNVALHLVLTASVYRFVRPRVGEGAALGAAALVGLDAPLMAYGLMGFTTPLGWRRYISGPRHLHSALRGRQGIRQTQTPG